MASGKRPQWLGIPIKHIMLYLLSFQNSLLILIMHYSRVMPLVNGRRYLPSTAVLAAEIIKLSISLTMSLYDISSRHPQLPATSLLANLIRSMFSSDCWKLAIPAVLYTLQNTLSYTASANLHPSTFSITYQLKILTTALFSVILLKRVLSVRKWASLLLLTLGVVLVQLPLTTDIPNESLLNGWLPRTLEHLRYLSRRSVPHLAKRSASYQGIEEDNALLNPRLNGIVGLISIAMACVSSGLAGVYFEKILKEHKLSGNPDIGLWTRNVQLSCWSLFPAIFGVALKDGEDVAQYGLFSGYNWIVWMTIILQAYGGILVSLVINYSNNIAKNFATSFGILLSLVASVFFFDLELVLSYVVGTAVVLWSTWLYNSENRSPPPLVINRNNTKPSASEPGYFDIERLRTPSGMLTPSREDSGLSTSRPSTPSVERHHFRVASGRRQLEKREI